MNERHEPRPDGTDRIEQLLSQAVARQRPSAADEQAIRETLRAEWLADTRRYRRRRNGWAAAGLAAVLVLTVATLRQTPDEPPVTAAPERLATAESVTGRATIGPIAAEAGAALLTGQDLTTAGAARLALRWRDGSSVRIDEHTSLRLTAAGEAELAQGRVYVDAGSSARPADAPVILTPAGPVRHLGTQYMVSVQGASADGAATRISVREGLVALLDGGAQRTAAAGQELFVGADGAPALRPAPAWGVDWRWAEAMAAPFAADGRTLAEFLDWVARETGRRVEFASAAAEERARQTELFGRIELEPLRALDVVLQTSDLVASVDNGIIRVRLRVDE